MTIVNQNPTNILAPAVRTVDQPPGQIAPTPRGAPADSDLGVLGHVALGALEGAVRGLCRPHQFGHQEHDESALTRSSYITG